MLQGVWTILRYEDVVVRSTMYTMLIKHRNGHCLSKHKTYTTLELQQNTHTTHTKATLRVHSALTLINQCVSVCVASTWICLMWLDVNLLRAKT